ncbi:MAG: DUF4258 domain-containing protein [Thermoplasmata archaeon]
MTPEVLYSKHARQRMVLRGISRKEVEAAIRSGSKTRQGGRIVSNYHYFAVVYVVQKNRCFVITVKPRW